MSKKHKKLLKALGYRSDRFLNSELKRMVPFTSSEGIYIGYNLDTIGSGKVRTVKEIESIKNKGEI